MRVIVPEQLINADLHQGDLCLPGINYPAGLLPINRRNPNMGTTLTIVRNQLLPEHQIFLENLPGYNNEMLPMERNGFINELESTIAELILQAYHNNLSDELLLKIFIYIQIWGGPDGRYPFVRGNSYMDNLDIEAYRNAITYLNENDHEAHQAANLYCNFCNGVGISFGTKHLSFWSQGQYPIFDNVIARILFGVDANNIDYNAYVEGMRNYQQVISAIKCENLSIHQIERTLFNWAETQDGMEWINCRINQ